MVIAYMAGIVDGEGCITITRRKIRRLKTNNWYYEPQVIVGNINKELISFCVDCYGGWIATLKRHNQNWATIYHWKVTGNEMKSLLNDIIPYLIVKKKQANIVLSFPKYNRNGQKRRTYIEKQEQENLWFAIKKLNSGGRRRLLKESKTSRHPFPRN